MADKELLLYRNPEARRLQKMEANRRSYARHREKRCAAQNAARDPAQWAARMREYRRNNPERMRALHQKYRKKYAAAYTERHMARQAHIKKAMPSWADRKAIRDIYAASSARTKSEGIQYHVDHIIPLKGKNVCGLHVHYNLQVLEASENIRKYNRVPDARRLDK